MEANRYDRNREEESELLRKYRESGDLALLGQLFKPYMPLVFGVSLKYFRDRERSRDAVMQIFEKIITELRKHEVHNLKSWLHVTTKNFCLMELRKKDVHNREVEFSEHSMESEQMVHHDHEDPMEADLENLSECMDRLKPEQKTCVEMFYMQQRSYREIVKLTEFDIKKVKSHLQNGKRNLKNCLEEFKNEKA